MRGLHVWYDNLSLPPGAPDNGVFAPVWGLLYVLMGLAAWLVWQNGRRGVAEAQRAAKALRRWGWQLLVNATWVPMFFGLRSPLIGLVVIVPMLVLIGITVRSFLAVRQVAGWLMLPYLLWTCYATYLTFGVWWLNPHG